MPLVALGVLSYLTGDSRATVARGEAEAEMSFMLPRAFMLPSWVIVTLLANLGCAGYLANEPMCVIPSRRRKDEKSVIGASSCQV
jgi:hypothetical protein